jgi:iron complex transport system permease protein
MLFGTSLGALCIGAFKTSIADVWAIFMQFGSQKGDATSFLVLHIRLPRILMAAVTGAGLAISGAAIQGLFRNPLAEPGLIGVSSGAMVFAVFALAGLGGFMAVLPAWLQQAVVSVAAFIGSVLTTYLVYFLSKRQGMVHVMTMLLAGIAITAFTAAITGMFIYFSDDQQLRDITFWTLGSLSGVNWSQTVIALPVVVGGAVLLGRYSKALNAMMLGEQEAKYLGFSVEKVKSHVILLTALIVGICISITGVIGFIGLIVPHFLRLIKGSDYRYLLAGSALLGALVLLVADTAARTVIVPAELPIGIITALVGAPFFLWLLLRSQRQNIIQ